MTRFLLIDAGDGEVHDEYEELRSAMMDAAVRAFGAPELPAVRRGLEAMVDARYESFHREELFRGPYGVWIVRAEQ